MRNFFASDTAHLAAAYYGFYTAAEFDPVLTHKLIRAAFDVSPSTFLSEVLYIAHRVAFGWPYNAARVEFLSNGAAVVLLHECDRMPPCVAFSVNNIVTSDLRDWLKVAPDLLPEELRSAFVLHASGATRHLPTP